MMVMTVSIGPFPAFYHKHHGNGFDGVVNNLILEPISTIRKYRIVQTEGKREVTRMVDFFNLDMIISVGYRVKSHVAKIEANS